MAEEKFMMVSLNEDQAKKIAQVLSNPTSTKILDELTKKEYTESELSKKLKIPISTVHYNLQQLQKAKLVVVEEFHYSDKGREINHYKLANKYIIIAPQEEKDSLLSRLKGLLPVTLLTVGGAIALKGTQMFNKLSSAGTMESKLLSAPMGVAVEETERAIPMAMNTMVADSFAIVNETVNQTVNQTVYVLNTQLPPVQTIPWWQSPLVDWAILGAFTVLFLVVLIEIIRYRRQ